MVYRKFMQGYLCLFAFLAAPFFGELKMNQTSWDRSKFAPKLEMDLKKFSKKLEEKLPSWAKDQINEDFRSFENEGIDTSLIDGVFRPEIAFHCKLLRIKIKNGAISYSIDSANMDNYFSKLMHAIEYLNSITKLPDVDFLVSLHDSLHVESPVPIFVFAKDKNLTTLPLIPDIEALNGYKDLRKQILKGNSKYPWDQKIKKIFWRGSTTGGLYTLDNWFMYPRSQLCFLSLSIAGAIDAKFVNVVQAEEGVLEKIKEVGIYSSSIPMKKYPKYRYLIDVDGNTCGFSRFYSLLLSNSLVFKTQTDNIQWYYKGLQPFKHYVPVNPDFSNLMDQYFWAEVNYPKIRKIIEKANSFVQDHLMDEDIYVYFAQVLKRYASLCEKSKSK